MGSEQEHLDGLTPMDHPELRRNPIEPPRFPEVLAAFMVCCTFGTLVAGGMVAALALL